jgi:hypothetical protein
MMPEQSSAGERMSTADFATANQHPERVTSDDSAKSTGQLGVSQDERRPVMRKDPDQADDKHSPLYPGNEAERFRGRWNDIQSGFVDEPRHAVEQADGLVAEMMQRLAQVFADERARLEQHWDRGGETDTEQLRQTLRRYRSFFDRLLTM